MLKDTFDCNACAQEARDGHQSHEWLHHHPRTKPYPALQPMTAESSRSRTVFTVGQLQDSIKELPRDMEIDGSSMQGLGLYIAKGELKCNSNE